MLYFRAWRARSQSLREVLVLGDSHAGVFNHKSFRIRYPKVFFNVVSVDGAAASGLENPNSTTQAYNTFRGALKNSKARKVVVMLGEVDTGFVIWYRAQKHQATVEAMFEKGIESYSTFLKEISMFFEVICLSAPLPTIQDGAFMGKTANARREVKATQLDRTAITLKFNIRMESFCTQNNMVYLMLDNESLNENVTVNKNLLNRNPSAPL